MRSINFRDAYFIPAIKRDLHKRDRTGFKSVPLKLGLVSFGHRWFRILVIFVSHVADSLCAKSNTQLSDVLSRTFNFFFNIVRWDLGGQLIFFLVRTLAQLLARIIADNSLGSLAIYDFTIEHTGTDVDMSSLAIRLSVDDKMIDVFPIIEKGSFNQWTVNGLFKVPVKQCLIRLDIIENGKKRSVHKRKTFGSHEFQTVCLLRDFLLLKSSASIRIDSASSITVRFGFAFPALEYLRLAISRDKDNAKSALAENFLSVSKNHENLYFFVAAALEIDQEDIRHRFLCALAFSNYTLAHPHRSFQKEKIMQAISLYEEINADDTFSLPIDSGIQYCAFLFWTLVSQFTSWHDAPTKDLRKVTDTSENILLGVPASTAAECQAFWNALPPIYRCAFIQVLGYAIDTPVIESNLTCLDHAINLLRAYNLGKSDESFVPQINFLHKMCLQFALKKRSLILHRESGDDPTAAITQLAAEFSPAVLNPDHPNPVWEATFEVLLGLAKKDDAVALDDHPTAKPKTSPLASALLGVFGLDNNPDIEHIKTLLENEEIPADVKQCLQFALAMAYYMRFQGSFEKDHIISGLKTLLQLQAGYHDSLLFIKIWELRYFLYEDLFFGDFLRTLKEVIPEQTPLPDDVLRRMPFNACKHDPSTEWVSEAKGAIESLRSGAQEDSLPLSLRYRLAELWARYATGNLDHDELTIDLEAPYFAMVDVLSQITWLQPSLEESYYELFILNVANFIGGSMSIAIGRNKFRNGIEWLEQGRSVVWQQLLQLRTPHDKLMQLHPNLAKEFVELSGQIESTRFARTENSTEEDVREQHYRELRFKRAMVIEMVRSAPGFEDFLRPTEFIKLLDAAAGGPVVVLTADFSQCHALILIPGCKEPFHIPLDLTLDAARTLQTKLSDLVESMSAQDTGYEYVLAKLWVSVAKPVLKMLAIHYDPTLGNYDPNHPTTQLPRVWWCPTGPFVMLPIHAAGNYKGGARPGSRLSDHVVSSYTPTLAALIQANAPCSKTAIENLHFLVVVQSHYLQPLTNLDCALDELEKIRLHTRGRSVDITELIDSQATVEAVKESLKQANWVHFACHGLQNTLRPSESAFALAGNEHLLLSDIIKTSLPHANLAFLSACHTAKGSILVPEESVHLAAGLLLAGFRGVVATMWEVADCDAPQIADGVYRSLLSAEVPDHRHAAYALHDAVNSLRDDCENRDFLRWVPYIHIGA